MPPSAAISTLYKWRGLRFRRGAACEQFIRCIGIFPVGSLVKLNSGEIGVVIAQNPAKRLQPRVMVVRDRGRPSDAAAEAARSLARAEGHRERALPHPQHAGARRVPEMADELFMK